MTNPTVDPSKLEKPRRRLFREYRRCRSWHQVANARGVNVAYVYNYARHGKVPANKEICKRLGIPTRRPRPADVLIEGVRICEQPIANLRNAFINRQELQ